jgi:mRNA-degrading endonuclease RelE of RelBE toxin-antitoxin system
VKIDAYESFWKHYGKLPDPIQKKVTRQIKRLGENFKHPSLRTKKIQGTHGLWEASADIHYRMSFEIREGTIYLRSVGNHDEVLKNP